MPDDLIAKLREGRDERGLFKPGNQAAKGNQGRAKMQELRNALLETGTAERILEVEAAVREMAVGGDIQAAKLWWSYMVGLPVQAVEVSSPDGSIIDLTAVVAVVMEALGDDQAARIRVAAAFKRMGRIEANGDGLG